MKLKQILSSTLALSLLATSALAESPLRQSDFVDITGHWGEGQIIEATERGFFKGQEETLFAPDATITRAEFTVVMLKIRDFDTDDTNNDGEWYKPYYTNAAEMGLLPDNFTLENFGEPITREEMAASLIKAIGAGNFEAVDGNEQEIPDYAEIGADFADFATQAFAAGFMKGDDDGNFTPSANATRAQASVVVLNAADFIYEMGGGEGNDVGSMLPGNPVSELLGSIVDASRSDEQVESVPVITSTTDPLWNMIQPLLGFTEDQVEGFAIATPIMSASSYCVAVVKPVEGQLEAIEDCFASFKETSVANAYPSGIEAAEAATSVTLENGLVVFVMADNMDDIMNALTTSLADINFADLATGEDPNVGSDMDLSPDMGVIPEGEVGDDLDVTPDMGVDSEDETATEDEEVDAEDETAEGDEVESEDETAEGDEVESEDETAEGEEVDAEDETAEGDEVESEDETAEGEETEEATAAEGEETEV